MTVRVFTQASLAGLLAMLVSVTPMVMGIVYAFSPTERRLGLMRPLSLAGIFAAAANICLGLVNALVYVGRVGPSDPSPLAIVAQGVAEALVMPFVAFACLTIGWLAVAIGMRKHV
ncbi:MAG: hypothetical protein DMF88_21820 [Acidobacteria bacterium]|nr:MAG: hypothetical protein DMF88_21820 [Acidobacteriota bacterium]